MRNYVARIDLNRMGIPMREKLVVIESDDWGSHRLPSTEAYQGLLQQGIRVDRSSYTRFDGLERTEDITLLLEILQKHKGSDGRPAVFTANTVMGNPDFEKIGASGFKEYYHKKLDGVYSELGELSTLELMDQGIEQGLWMPQFHGREHVNVKKWMYSLQQKIEPFYTAFGFGVWGLSSDIVEGSSIQAAFDSLDTKESLDIIKEGLLEFNRIFKFNSKSFIANNYIWSSELSAGLLTAGVQHFQGMKYQLLPRLASQEKRKKIRHFSGERNVLGQTYSVRNCHFEPVEKGHTVEGVLQEVASAFWWNRPVIICTHRINYTSRLAVSKRDENLRNLDLLLTEIVKRWPDVRFVSSAELADVLKKDRQARV